MTETKKAALAQYFDAVDRRIRKLAGGDLHYDLSVCGKRLRVHYASMEDMKRSGFSFTGMIDETEGMPDAHLSYWRDSAQHYLPDSNTGGNDIYKAKDETGELTILPQHYVKGTDHIQHRYYFCKTDGKDTPLFGNSHDLLTLLDTWARDNGMYIFHGAVVGTEGKGVIIAGRSHAGKSTLSVGCMLRGMDLVADDQFAAEKVDGTVYAMPVYRIIGLNPDSYERLKPAFPVVDHLEPWEEKIFMDITERKLPEHLGVCAVIVPELAGAPEPEIHPCAKGPAIVRIVQSSVADYRGNDTPQTIAGMSRMLSDLPVYEMKLSTDVHANAEELERFIREDLL